MKDNICEIKILLALKYYLLNIIRLIKYTYKHYLHVITIDVIMLMG